MVGSRKTFKYETDSGELFTYDADESNTEGLIGGAAVVDPDFTPTDETSIRYRIPPNLKPRRAIFVTGDRLRRKSIIVPTVELKDAYTAEDFTVASQFITESVGGVSYQYRFQRLKGEERIKPLSSDTAILDGDAD